MAYNPALIFLTFLAQAFVSLLVILITIWGSLALYYQLSESRVFNAVIIGLWVLIALAALSTIWFADLYQFRKALFIVFTLVFAVLLIWWHSIKPSLNRDWAPEVAQTVTADFKGDQVRLNHIRDFDWRTEKDFTANWKSADYDLNQIKSVDLFLSYWAGPAIAHTLVSFGFEDGRYVVFSAEIRKKRGQAFSEIGGFFKDFELAMIAAEESDIVYLRTNVRGERVYRYHVDIAPEQARQLFRLYTDTANRLSKDAGFYNTLTANCTTVVFDMARILDPSIALDYRVLLSGYLPEYMFEKELILTPETNTQSMRLNADISAQAKGSREGYSQRIRTAPMPQPVAAE
ncbi:DUF4105 domain-containing protein [Pseudochrobactrum sp. sp1633]|uniref:Lnb N-terminal periplasmic domain-containing protein n=1 Tax=Pseudochrobactrum sp. sp1633 TaxID=3036706 RepID=UPI0025A507F1|nr:DUF4105 domain-containing protein [Pseudochrobactrum sp. sp1633]MDM8345966.1 DUF4105 domain-containing protein [Pseudochrobactrum sp. sp1633]HWD12171.1 DUF4105 domain-containing protein [Pseudochrobactrum sp.]